MPQAAECVSLDESQREEALSQLSFLKEACQQRDEARAQRDKALAHMDALQQELNKYFEDLKGMSSVAEESHLQQQQLC